MNIEFEIGDINKDFKESMKYMKETFELAYRPEDYSFNMRWPTPNDYKDYIKSIVTEKSFFVFPTIDKKRIGHIILKKQNNDGYLSLLYLTKENRGKGYAKSLEDYAIKTLQLCRCSSVKLSVSPQNKPAYNLYIKTGWHDLGEGSKKNVHIMEKKL